MTDTQTDLISSVSRISPRRGHQLPGVGAPTYDFAKFSQKLHEIERIQTPREGCIPHAPPPLDPSLLTEIINYLHTGADL